MDAHGPFQPIFGFDRDIYSVPNSWHSSKFNTDSIMFGEDNIENNMTEVRFRRELYGAAIDYLDKKVHNLINFINNSTQNESTIIITSDHGDNLGYEADDHLLDHTSSLTEGILHVPFIIINPPEGFQKFEKGYFSQLNVPMLVRGIYSEKTPDVFSNQIPAELIGKSATVDIPSSEQDHWNRMIRCGYNKNQKYVWDTLGNKYMYQLDSNKSCWQAKQRELSKVPERLKNLFSEDIFEYKRAAEKQGEKSENISNSTRSRLQELGYL